MARSSLDKRSLFQSNIVLLTEYIRWVFRTYLFGHTLKYLSISTHVCIQRTWLRKQSSTQKYEMILALWTLGKRLAFLCLYVQLGVVSEANCQNFSPSSQASCFTVKWFKNPIQVKNSPIISPKLCFVWIFNLFFRSSPCQQVIQMQPWLARAAQEGLEWWALGWERRSQQSVQDSTHTQPLIFLPVLALHQSGQMIWPHK